ncbi:dynamin family protein [Salipaludibacillus aurantiacus]|uniref:dynamin family protein n=1 Tax=Salipaludibacillus aurantiacus TaxID=1601833 RepID=UPI0015A644B8|nr:dynamin family protein [Salipaludibacillus aurantiacus]
MHKLKTYPLEKLRSKTLYTDQRSLETLSDLSCFIQEADRSESGTRGHYYLGEIYFFLGDIDAAISHWNQVGVMDYTLSVWAEKNIADAMRKKGNLKKAIACYERIQPLDTDLYETVLYELAELTETIGDYRSFYYHLKLLAVNPLYSDVMERSYHLFISHELHETALKVVGIALKNSPSLKWFSRYRENRSHVSECGKLLPFQLAEGLIRFNDDEFLENDFFYFCEDSVDQELIHTFLYFVYDHISEERRRRHQQRYEAFLAVCIQRGFLVGGDTKESLEALYEVTEQTGVGFYVAGLLKGKMESEYESLAASSILRLLSRFQEVINDYVRSLRVVRLDPVHFYWHESALDESRRSLMLCGTFNNGKTSFIHSILNQEIAKTDLIPTTSTVSFIEAADRTLRYEITGKTELKEINQEDFLINTTIDHDNDEGRHNQKRYLVKTPFKRFDQVRFIDTPGFNDRSTDQNATFENLHYADALLYIMSAEHPFTRIEKETIDRIRETAPGLPIHIVVNKMDYVYDDEVTEVMENVQHNAMKYISRDIKVFPYSCEEEFFQREIITWLDSEDIEIQYTQRVRNWLNSIPEYLNQLNKKQQQVDLFLKQQLEESELQLTFLESQSEAIVTVYSQVADDYMVNVKKRMGEWNQSTFASISNLIEKTVSQINDSQKMDKVAVHVQIEIMEKFPALIRKEILTDYIKLCMNTAAQVTQSLFARTELWRNMDHEKKRQEAEAKAQSVINDIALTLNQKNYDAELSIQYGGVIENIKGFFQDKEAANRRQVEEYVAELRYTGVSSLFNRVLQSFQQEKGPEEMFELIYGDLFTTLKNHNTELISEAEKKIEHLKKMTDYAHQDRTTIEEEVHPTISSTLKFWEDYL